MNNIVSLSKSLELQKQKFDADILKYTQEIAMVLLVNEKDHNSRRMMLGKVFITSIKQEMGEGLVKAGIFGSVSRNEAKDTSDVDIVLFTKQLSSEEKQEHNSHARQLERGYGAYAVLNFAYNSHRINELEKVFTEKTGIPVRCMIYDYDEKDFADIQQEIKFITILE